MPTNKKGGLEGVVAATTTISRVDGTRGKLWFRGIDIHDLAEKSTFEETAYLIWYGVLPDRSQLQDLERRLYSARDLPPDLLRMIVEFMPGWDSMEALRTSVSALSGDDPEGLLHEKEREYERMMALTARMPVIVASYWRARQGQQPLPPRHDMGAAANFLYMLTGRVPNPRMAKYLDVALLIHEDHELNASTFAARVAASTLADMYCAVTAAIGTLDGPLHGGANEEVMAMLEEIGQPDRAEQYVKQLLAQGKKVPGFGHRVYKTADPRATEMKKVAAALAKDTGDTRWVDIARKVEEAVKKEIGLNANLDFVSAQVYHMLGIPTDLFTPLFACSRIVGWTAHILEQYDHNRLIRPIAEYVGPMDVAYVPIDDRKIAKAA